jgi:hypothetical protein
MSLMSIIFGRVHWAITKKKTNPINRRQIQRPPHNQCTCMRAMPFFHGRDPQNREKNAPVRRFTCMKCPLGTGPWWPLYMNGIALMHVHWLWGGRWICLLFIGLVFFFVIALLLAYTIITILIVNFPGRSVHLLLIMFHFLIQPNLVEITMCSSSLHFWPSFTTEDYWPSAVLNLVNT